MRLAAALDLCRFTELAALMLLWGAGGFLAWLTPRPLQARLAPRLRPVFDLCAVLAALAILATLPLLTGMMGAGWPDLFNLEIMRPLLLRTTVGQAWAVQAGSLVLLAAAFLLRGRPQQLPSIAAAAGISLASMCLTGHAAAQIGLAGIGQRANDALHLLSAGFWVGALIPLAMALARLSEPNDRAASMLALQRFATAASVAVAIIVATGVINTLLILGTWPLPWGSPYQALLITKLVLVLLMLALAAVNRFVLTPRLPNEAHAAARLRLHTLSELALGIAVVALVAVFSRMDPFGRF